MAPLIGCLDEVDRGSLHGWARDPDFPDSPFVLLVPANDHFIERVVANRHRPDVEEAGFGTGRFGFSVVFNPPLLPNKSWLIRVCSEADGRDMPGSPIRIPASDEFDERAQAAFAAALANTATEAELEQRIRFLTAQRERLLQMRADRQSAEQRRHRRRAWLEPEAVAPRRALVLDDQGVPEPNRDGGSGALLSHMRSLQRLGYAVSFAAPQMTDGPPAAALRHEQITVCHAPWYNSVEEVLRRDAGTYDVVYLHRVATAAAYANLVRRYMPRARLIYSVADLHHLRLARQSAVEGRPELMAEARRVKAQELWAAQTADAVITHSSAEAALLREAIPATRVHVMAWSVPCRRRAAGFNRRRGMAFIGNFRHAPNIAACLLLRDEIMPAVQAADPAIVCKLVGSDLPASLQRQHPGIDIVGRVADIRAVFDSVRLTIAPLRFGAGLKAKVIESLAAGVPCVCSPAAAEGLDFPPGLRELVVSDTASMVAAIRRLHGDAEYNAEMAALALAFAKAAFSEARLDEAMGRATGGVTAVASRARSS